jgi:hypothetical protein
MSPLLQLWGANGVLLQAEITIVDSNTISVSFNNSPGQNVNVVVGAGIPQSGTAAGAYRHYQTAAATSWTVPHNLGFRPSVMVVDSAHDQIFPGNVLYSDDNTVVLSFSAAVGGEAYLS